MMINLTYNLNFCCLENIKLNIIYKIMEKRFVYYTNDEVTFKDIVGKKTNLSQPKILHLKGILRRKSK